MPTSNIIHNYQLPKIYRILVIDDKIGKNIAFQNCFRACIRANSDDGRIEIDYSKSVDDGFRKWLNNSYDMVLIDYDFIETAKDIDAEKFELSAIFPNRAGAGLLKFLIGLINNKNSDYYYKKDYQKIYIWTSHDWHKEASGKQEGVDIDFHGEEKNYYYKKKNDSDPDSECVLTIEQLCDELKKIDSTHWSLEYILERLVSLTLSKNKNFGLDGYVAFKKNGKETNTLYSPLVDTELKFEENENGYLYLLPDEPKQSDFTYYCSIDKLQITRKLNRRLNGNDLRKALYGKVNAEDKTKLLEINIRHSASLDKNSQDIKEKKEEYKDFFKFCGSSKENDNQEPNNNAKAFAGVKLKSDIWLAATPLTMVTRAGEDDDVIDLLISKLNAFFDIGVGAAVLKTTYLNLKNNDIEWPKDHIQRHHRTRVFDPSELKIKTEDLVKESSEWYQEELSEKLKGVHIKAPLDYQLWNAGKTALESFPPKMINMLLKKIAEKKMAWSNRIIVSLGSKDTVKENWEELFRIIFTGVNNNFFPLVEINVRHFMRPLLSEYLGGDEYLSPMDKNKIHNYSGLFFEFSEWLKKLHSLGTIFNKKIILKFTFRSDIIPFLRIAEDIAEIDKIDAPNNYGISGVTLINTVKSPYPYRLEGGKKPSSDDSIKIPQMSGEFLAWTRNYLLHKINQIGFRLPVSVSGGVGIAEDDIDYIRQNYEIVKSIQIGTYFLKRIDSEQINKLKSTPSEFLKAQDKTNMSSQMVHLEKHTCITHPLGRCGACYNSYYCDAFLNRGAKYEVPLIDITACTGCGLCVQNCISNALQMKPANKYVILCCPFSESRAFILRGKKIPFMFMTPEKTNRNLNNDIEKIKEKAIKEASNRAEKCYKKAMKNISKESKKDGEINPLEHSIFLGVKTYILGEKNGSGYKETGVPSSKENVKAILEHYNKFKAITAYSCLKDGEPIKSEAIESDDFTLNITNSNIDEYSQHGINKAGGIDILGYGSLLFGDLSDRENDVMTFAGLPLEVIIEIDKSRNKQR